MRDGGQIIGIVFCIHEILWLLLWMDSLYSRRQILSGKTRFFVTIVSCGMIWYGMKYFLSGASALLLFTILFMLLWDCTFIDSVSIVSAYLFALTFFLKIVEYFPKKDGFFGQTIWLLANLILIIWLRYGKRQIYNSTIKMLGLLGLSFFISVFLCDFLIDIIYGNNIRDYLFLSCLLIILLGYYFYFWRLQMSEKICFLDAQYHLIEQNYLKTQTFYTENAKLYHDMMHHLRAVQRMITNGENRDALEYLESIQEPLLCNEISVYTGIDIVDTVIYEAEEKAKSKEICLKVESTLFPNIIKIQKKELCALFANLLDNALEAASEEITLNIKSVYGFLIVETTNDFKESPQIENQHFVSKKKEKMKHGWGMQIMEQIVKKYDGCMEISVEDKVRIKILLNL